jgi:hypothetical protein
MGNYRRKSSTYEMDLLLNDNDNNSNSKKKHSQQSDVLNFKNNDVPIRVTVNVKTKTIECMEIAYEVIKGY